MVVAGAGVVDCRSSARMAPSCTERESSTSVVCVVTLSVLVGGGGVAAVMVGRSASVSIVVFSDVQPVSIPVSTTTIAIAIVFKSGLPQLPTAGAPNARGSDMQNP